jgi:hypothetical protein
MLSFLPLMVQSMVASSISPHYYSEQSIVYVRMYVGFTTRFARDTETQRVRDLLLCREIAAQQNHHACGALVR